MVVFTPLHVLAKTCTTVHPKRMNLAICKLHLNDPDLQTGHNEPFQGDGKAWGMKAWAASFRWGSLRLWYVVLLT